MGRVPITVMGFRCERCEYEWIPRSASDEGPATCPRCKSPYWNRPRKNVEGYEHFRDAIRKVLETSPDGQTWTEIRTKAKLVQKFPNNVWVKRLETEIGLIRAKDEHGIFRWRLSQGGDHAQSNGVATPDRLAARSAAKQAKLE
jgi:hypothetical protein